MRIWFVEQEPGTYLVQHTAPRAAQWYANLVANPAVILDTGSGPTEARAEPVADRSGIEEVLRLIRRKYPAGWVFRLLGWNRHAVAARLVVG